MMGTILATIASIIGGYVTDWQQGRDAKRKLKQAITDNKIRLASDEQSHNQAWEMAVLEGRDKFLRRTSFILITFPLVWSWVDPAGARFYFEVALAALPGWYIKAYLGVLAAIWGLSELKGIKR